MVRVQAVLVQVLVDLGVAEALPGLADGVRDVHGAVLELVQSRALFEDRTYIALTEPVRNYACSENLVIEECQEWTQFMTHSLEKDSRNIVSPSRWCISE